MQKIFSILMVLALSLPVWADSISVAEEPAEIEAQEVSEANQPALAPQASDADFQAANALYAGGNYADAAQAYLLIVSEQPSAEVYYNLGNAYFKMGEVAQSILAYERALRLRPNYADAKFNLRFAEAKIVDNIQDNRRFFLVDWAEGLRNLLSESAWFGISVALFLLCLTGFFLFAFLRSVVARKASFHCAWVALLVSMIALWCALSIHHRNAARAEAIITQGIVNAKSSPDKSGTDLFVLHEGTKVHIQDNVSDWVEIHVGDNVGWIRLSALERI